ncbi:MAG TPA: DUF4340 domain-containing protein [Candidatus Acidoferrum sp.]|nr:DUF4340 domain-containing protein [Candidatus Acidoferrum sp.]
MLNKNILGGVLAVQLVLAAALYFTNLASSHSQLATPLVAGASEVDKLVVTDGKTTATVTKAGDGWQAGKLPASAIKVSTLLEELGKLGTRFPVVSSAAGRERFEVDDKKFQRHLTLYHGDKTVADLYFGTSPGFRQTHVRRAGDSDVFAVAYNNNELQATDADWLDKGLLKVDKFDHVSGADFELVKDGDHWKLTPGANADALPFEEPKAAALATTIENLQVQKAADTVPTGETHNLTVANGKDSWVFKFTKAGSDYYVQRSDRDQAFTISNYDYERLGAATRASLLQTPPTPPAAAKPVSAAKAPIKKK